MTIDYRDRIAQIQLYREVLNKASIALNKIDREIIIESIISELKEDNTRFFFSYGDFVFYSLYGDVWIQHDVTNKRIDIKSDFLDIFKSIGLSQKQGERLLKRMVNRHLN